MSNTFFQGGKKFFKGVSPRAPPWLRAWQRPKPDVRRGRNYCSKCESYCQYFI